MNSPQLIDERALGLQLVASSDDHHDAISRPPAGRSGAIVRGYRDLLRGGEKIRVLLVEDNPADVEVIQEFLRDTGEADLVFDFQVCETLSKAIESLALGPEPDLVLLDPHLPDSAGVGTIRRIREASQDLPLVVLTGTADETLEVEALRAGAHDYVHKSKLQSILLHRVVAYALTRYRSRRLAELERNLETMRRLASEGAPASVARVMAGVAPLKDSDPELFKTLTKTYVDLLDSYLNFVLFSRPKPTEIMQGLVSTLGAAGGGPRDLIDVHVGGLEFATRVVRPDQSRAYTVHGRLLALEMMGLLVDFYRVGSRRQATAIEGEAAE